jgi:putative ABC transport system substrate-binding protein
MKRDTRHWHTGSRRRVRADDARCLTRRQLLIAIGAGALTTSFAAFSQQSARVARVGFINVRPRAENRNFSFFMTGMQSLGYVEGKNLNIVYLTGEVAQFTEMAAELVRQGVGVIVAPNPETAIAAKNVTTSVPIVVVVVGDPVRSGLAKSLARPGGNVTGLTAFGSDLGGKRIELLKEFAPRLTRVGAIWNPTVPDKVIEWIETERAARTLGVQLLSLEVKAAGEFDAAYATARRLRAEAIVVFGLPLMFENGARTAAFANEARIPAIFPWRETVEAGGLMSLGPSINDNYRRAAGYVDKVLKGAKPAELPIEQPVTLELFVNARTARAIGIKIPNAVLVRADKVIE